MLIIAMGASSQIVEPVKWTFSQSKVSEEEFDLHLTAKIDNGWHLYGTELPDGGPVKTSFYFEILENVELTGDIVPSKETINMFDPSFQLQVNYYETEVTFTQRVKMTEDFGSVKGYVEFMSCNDETCTPPMNTEFSFELKGGNASDIKTGTNDAKTGAGMT